LTWRAAVDSRLLLKAGLSRGDLNEAEWRVLKGLLPIEPENRGRGRPPEQNRSIHRSTLMAFAKDRTGGVPIERPGRYRCPRAHLHCAAKLRAIIRSDDVAGHRPLYRTQALRRKRSLHHHQDERLADWITAILLVACSVKNPRGMVCRIL